MSQIFGDNSQDEKLRKEEAKIMMRRQANEDRRERLLNPRSRLIGIDVESLNAQSDEARNRRELENQKKKIDKLRADEVEKFLERNAEEERQMKMNQMQQLKDAWENNLEQKRINQMQYKQDKHILENTSLSAAQEMKGEDLQMNSRIEMQREQMRQWIQQELQEKNDKLMNDRSYEMKYNNMLKMLNEIREQDEKDELEFRKNAQLQMLKDNQDLAKERKLISEYNDPDRLLSLEEKLKATSLDLFNEDKTIAVNDNTGKITRVDMFKGFTMAQREKIQLENEVVIQQRREYEEAERRRQQDWARQQAMLLDTLENNHQEEERMRKTDREDQLAYLKQQAHEQAVRNIHMQKDKFGSIEPGFYNNFGKSCR